MISQNSPCPALPGTCDLGVIVHCLVSFLSMKSIGMLAMSFLRNPGSGPGGIQGVELYPLDPRSPLSRGQVSRG